MHTPLLALLLTVITVAACQKDKKDSHPAPVPPPCADATCQVTDPLLLAPPEVARYSQQGLSSLDVVFSKPIASIKEFSWYGVETEVGDINFIQWSADRLTASFVIPNLMKHEAYRIPVRNDKLVLRGVKAQDGSFADYGGIVTIDTFGPAIVKTWASLTTQSMPLTFRDDGQLKIELNEQFQWTAESTISINGISYTGDTEVCETRKCLLVKTFTQDRVGDDESIWVRITNIKDDFGNATDFDEQIFSKNGHDKVGPAILSIKQIPVTSNDDITLRTKLWFEITCSERLKASSTSYFQAELPESPSSNSLKFDEYVEVVRLDTEKKVLVIQVSKQDLNDKKSNPISLRLQDLSENTSESSVSVYVDFSL